MEETPTQGGGVEGGASFEVLHKSGNSAPPLPLIVLRMKILGFHLGSLIKLCHKETDFLLT